MSILGCMLCTSCRAGAECLENPFEKRRGHPRPGDIEESARYHHTPEPRSQSDYERCTAAMPPLAPAGSPGPTSNGRMSVRIQRRYK